VAIEDAEALLFGLGKQYRVAPYVPAFIMRDATYRRFRALAVSETDRRRLFGVDSYADYVLAGYPVKINNDVAASTAIFAALNTYRMYRRLGMTMRWTSEGETLMRKNTSLLAVRGRFGGRPTLGEAVALCTDLGTAG
jgi:HK97 family phage major capsid protein